MGFLSNFVGVKTDQAVKSGMEALVRWDPKGATEAELRTMEQQLDGLGLKVAGARQAYDKEQREATEARKLYNTRMAAAEVLQRQIGEATSDADRASKEASLTRWLDTLEQSLPDVEREESEAKDAKDFLDTLEGTYNQAGAKLKNARADLQRAQTTMAKAEQQREQAKMRADAARQAAGLATATSTLGTALGAMQDAAARDLREADAMNRKATILAPTTPEKDDPNIAAALAAASGAPAKPTSAADRLAALRSRAA